MNIKKNAEKYGIEFAREIFEDFLRPEFRGENFTWVKFPEIAARLAGVHFPLSLSLSPDNMQELKTIVFLSAKKESIRLVKEKGL